MTIDTIAGSNPASPVSTMSGITGNGAGDDLSNMFLDLLVAQISHQNPLDPLDGTQYVSQLAEFSNVESLQSIRQNTAAQVDSLDSMLVLEATSLVGKTVDVPVSTQVLEQSGSISGRLNLSNAAEAVTVQLYDASGDLITQQQMNYNGAGSVRFDFADQPAGTYQIKAFASSQGLSSELQPWLSGQVERVSVGNSADDIVLQVGGLGHFTLGETNQLAASA